MWNGCTNFWNKTTKGMAIVNNNSIKVDNTTLYTTHGPKNYKTTLHTLHTRVKRKIHTIITEAQWNSPRSEY